MTNFKSALFMNAAFLTSVKLRFLFFVMFVFVFFSSFALATDTVYRNVTIVNANSLENALGVQSIGLCNNLTSNVRLKLNSQALIAQIAPNDDNSNADGEEDIQLTPDKYGGVFVGIVVLSLLLSPLMLLFVWFFYKKKLLFRTMLLFSIILSTIFIIGIFFDILYFNKKLMKFWGPIFAIILVFGPSFLLDKELKAPDNGPKTPNTKPKK